MKRNMAPWPGGRRKKWAVLVFWVLVVAQRTGGYIGPVLKHAGHELVKLILGNAGPK